MNRTKFYKNILFFIFLLLIISRERFLLCFRISNLDNTYLLGLQCDKLIIKRTREEKKKYLQAICLFKKNAKIVSFKKRMLLSQNKNAS